MRLRKFCLLVSCLLMSLCSRGREPGPGLSEGLVQTLPWPAPSADSWSELLALPVLQASPPTVRMESSPGMFLRTTWDHALHSWFLIGYQVFDLQLSCIKKEKRNSGQ